MVASVDEFGAFGGQHDVVAGDGVVAVCVGAGGEANGQVFARGFFVTGVESTGDGTCFGGVFDDGGRCDVDQRNVVNQGHSRLAFAGRAEATSVSNSQVDFR